MVRLQQKGSHQTPLGAGVGEKVLDITKGDAKSNPVLFLQVAVVVDGYVLLQVPAAFPRRTPPTTTLVCELTTNRDADVPLPQSATHCWRQLNR